MGFDKTDMRGGFSLVPFQPWMGERPVATAMMSRVFSGRLAELIFETTDAEVDPDMIAFAHQIRNLNKNAMAYFASRSSNREKVENVNIAPIVNVVASQNDSYASPASASGGN